MNNLPTWSEDLSVGNDLVDSQHKRLIELCKMSANYADANTREGKERFHALINDLTALVKIHFATEEGLLKKNNCPFLAQHQAEHDAYTEKLIELLVEATSGRLDNAGVQQVASEWLINHVLETDLKCKAYFAA